MTKSYEAFNDLFDLFQDFDRLFHRTMGPFKELPRDMIGFPRLTAGTIKGDFTPAVECLTRDEQMVLRAELPGVDPKDLEVTIVADKIFLRGEKKEERTETGKDLLFRETAFGRFERAFTLPEGVNPNQVMASFRNGVLEVAFPAGTKAPVRTVPVETGEGAARARKVA